MEFVGVIRNHTILQSSEHPIIRASNFFGVHRVHPGRLTCFPCKSPMNRKENDLNQISMILFHVKPIFIIQSFNHPNHPIMQSSNFWRRYPTPIIRIIVQPSGQICRVSAPWPHRLRSWLQFSPTRPVDRSGWLKPKVAPRCLCPAFKIAYADVFNKDDY